jgi:hypothetical protein
VVEHNQDEGPPRPREAGRERDARKRLEARADLWGRVAALVVVGVGLVVVVLPAVLHLGEVWENPFVPSTTTVLEVTTRPNGTEVRKTTTTEAERSFVERSLAAGGLVLLRVGAVALAAFIAGAVVQRAILGRFDLKLGPLELTETKRAAEASEEGLAAVEAGLRDQVRATTRAMNLAAGAAEGVAALHDDTAQLKEDLARLLGLFEEGGAQVAKDADVDVQFGEEQDEGRSE